MFYYVYYSAGNGVHESRDDVAIIRAWTEKQAEKILRQNVNVDNLIGGYYLYRLRGSFPKSAIKRFARKSKIHFISEY